MILPEAGSGVDFGESSGFGNLQDLTLEAFEAMDNLKHFLSSGRSTTNNIVSLTLHVRIGTLFALIPVIKANFPSLVSVALHQQQPRGEDPWHLPDDTRQEASWSSGLSASSFVKDVYLRPTSFSGVDILALLRLCPEVVKMEVDYYPSWSNIWDGAPITPLDVVQVIQSCRRLRTLTIPWMDKAIAESDLQKPLTPNDAFITLEHSGGRCEIASPRPLAALLLKAAPNLRVVRSSGFDEYSRKTCARLQAILDDVGRRSEDAWRSVIQVPAALSAGPTSW
jgi:hypothetical protein